jgi:hypothetical protein
MVAEDKKEVKETGDGKEVNDIDEKELHGRASCLQTTHQFAHQEIKDGTWYQVAKISWFDLSDHWFFTD